MKKALKPLLIFLIILTVFETVFPFLPEDWQFFILLFFLIPVIYPCLAICTYITGAKTGECLSGKTLERFVIALIAAVLITFLIRPYHSIISNLHAYGRTSFISWVFFNKTNGIIAIVLLALFWIGEEVGFRRIKSKCRNNDFVSEIYK